MSEVIYSNEQIKGDIAFLKYLVKKFQVVLIDGTGLAKLIEQCEFYINAKEFKQEELKPLIVLNTLVNSLKTLWLNDIDFSIQLKAMNSGNFEYGRADAEQDHYFKDFEFEIFSASQLIQNKVGVDLPQHTTGEDIEFQDIDIQCKHPSTTNQVQDLMKSFTARLNTNGRYGVFGMAVEDCFGFSQRTIFEDNKDFETYIQAKLTANEADLEILLKDTLAKCTRILGLYTTASFFVYINGEGLRMVRLTNSIFCFRPDRKEIKDDAYKQAYKLITTFNPHPTWLTIEKQIVISIN